MYTIKFEEEKWLCTYSANLLGLSRGELWFSIHPAGHFISANTLGLMPWAVVHGGRPVSARCDEKETLICMSNLLSVSRWAHARYLRPCVKCKRYRILQHSNVWKPTLAGWRNKYSHNPNQPISIHHHIPHTSSYHEISATIAPSCCACAPC